MKLTPNYFLIAFVLSLFGTCKSRETDNAKEFDQFDTTLTKRWYYPSGVLEKIKLYKNDSIGLYKFYYRNGAIQKIQWFKRDTIEDGLYLFYFQNGKLQDSAQIVNGKFHGQRKEYFESGKINTIATYNNGNLRCLVKYKRDGKLETYNGLNYTGDTRFEIKYGPEGRFEKFEGSAITSLSYANEIGSDSLKIELLVSRPPNCITKVYVTQINKFTREKVKLKEGSPNHLLQFGYSTINKSNIEITNLAVIRDTITNLTITDTLILRLDKNGKPM
jgi:antitoxin component YwqK of YwqJK toxin-antitoxin module